LVFRVRRSIRRTPVYELSINIIIRRYKTRRQTMRGTLLVSDDDIREILRRYTTVAVVGLSRNPSKDSYEVAEYLKNRGYRIVPINPVADEILGERSYGSLLDLPEELKRSVEIVVLFRPSEAVPPFVEDAIRLRDEYGGPDVIWMQLGIVNEEAAEKARNAGMTVVMDKCIKVEHQRLL
jgi:predicted CoA-binding protein